MDLNKIIFTLSNVKFTLTESLKISSMLLDNCHIRIFFQTDKHVETWKLRRKSNPGDFYAN